MFNGENVVFIKLLSYCQVQWMKRAMVSVQESTKMLRRLLMKHSWKKQKLSYRRKKLSYQKRHTLWLDVLLKRPFSGQIRDSGLRRFMEDRSWKSPSSAAKFRAALRGSAAKVATSEASCSRGGTLDVMAEKKHFVPVRFLEKPFQYQVLSWTFTISLSILFHFLPQACFSSDVLVLVFNPLVISHADQERQRKELARNSGLQARQRICEARSWKFHDFKQSIIGESRQKVIKCLPPKWCRKYTKRI